MTEFGASSPDISMNVSDKWYVWASPTINFGLNDGVTFNKGEPGDLSFNEPASLQTDVSGVYQAVVNFSIQVTNANSIIKSCLTRNNVPIPDTDVRRNFPSVNSSGAFSITTLLDADVGDRFGIIMQSDVATIPNPQLVTVDNISFNLTKVVGIGDQGATGAQGGLGLQGATGAQGDQGLQGATGAQGDQGLQGATGAQGDQGLQGATGAQGDQGLQGATGAQGNIGTTGAQGAIGADGTHTGAQGAAGQTGATPVNYDSNMTPAGNFPMDLATFLPAGNNGRNALPIGCDSFIYLEVKANLVSLGFTDSETVYVPCYFRAP
jgi:hypothetical protein